ncbi:hypothetical protein LCGC14_0370730 [marine sediment metagenome]|uniref:Uncharacterized protein n=1 Tax=marine sediment metagenome TaxID=412755 RepID=A0A0F9TN82_9ZZZZ|nr:hypothetical protein [Maribacter sp.]HDZ04836.1 hypothetical protein [Maribacter sp.]
MSLVLKDNPVLVDIQVNNLQKHLFTDLTTKASWTDYQSYPRVYVNVNGLDIIPEHYLESNEYEDVFFDDSFNVSSFFLVNPTREYDANSFTSEISIVFQGKLDQLYPGVLHRADEEMHNDIFLAINRSDAMFELESFVTGRDNVYTGLTLSAELSERISQDDMSDFHFVRFNLSVEYDENDVCIE